MMKKEHYIVLDIEKLPEGYYLATSKDVQGLVAQAKTFEETLEIAKDLAKKILPLQKTKPSFGEKIIYPLAISA